MLIIRKKANEFALSALALIATGTPARPTALINFVKNRLTFRQSDVGAGIPTNREACSEFGNADKCYGYTLPSAALYYRAYIDPWLRFGPCAVINDITLAEDFDPEDWEMRCVPSYYTNWLTFSIATYFVMSEGMSRWKNSNLSHWSWLMRPDSRQDRSA